MKRYLCRLFVTAVLLASAVVPANAAPQASGNFTEFETLFNQSTGQNHSYIQDASTRRKLDRPLHLGGKVKRLGRFRVRFDTEKIMHLTGGEDSVRLLQGSAVAVGNNGVDEVGVAGTITALGKNAYSIQANFLNEGIGRGVSPDDAIVTIKLLLRRDSTGALRVVRLYAPKHRLKSIATRRCSVHGSNKTHRLGNHTSPLPIDASAEFKTVSVLVEGDSELAGQAEAADLPAYLADMMNTVDLWYRRDLGVSLNATIESTPQSYSSDTSYNNQYQYYLHEEMRDHRPADSRAEYMHFLVTGKSNGDDLAGVVPDIGTICQNKSDSIGFTIFYPGYNTFNIETTAHEMGHLFAAEHDDNHTNASVAYLMFSGTSSRDSSISEFSDYSKAQISNHLTANTSCLGSEVGDTPSDDTTPRLSTLELRRVGRLRTYRGRMVVVPYDQFGRKIRRGLTVSMYCGSAADGPFATLMDSKAVRAKKAKFVLWYDDLGFDIYCQAQSGEILSEMVQAIEEPYEGELLNLIIKD